MRGRWKELPPLKEKCMGEAGCCCAPSFAAGFSRVPWSQPSWCYCATAPPLSTWPWCHCTAAGSQASPNLQRPGFPPVAYHQPVSGYFGGQIPDSAGMGSMGSMPLGAVVDITVGSTGQVIGAPAGKWGCEEWSDGRCAEALWVHLAWQIHLGSSASPHARMDKYTHAKF